MVLSFQSPKITRTYKVVLSDSKPNAEIGSHSKPPAAATVKATCKTLKQIVKANLQTTVNQR